MPSIPLTPPKVIPAFDETRKRSIGKGGKSPNINAGEELLIDFSTPAPNISREAVVMPMAASEDVLDPFSPIVRLSDEQGTVSSSELALAAAAREREEDERRQSEKKAILEQRAARRKSMANRRVSFAPEATLHTWSVMEMAEDSTTSSASNSTRRQSSSTAASSPRKGPRSPRPRLDTMEAPSTPPEQTDEQLVQASPDHQRYAHQKKRRRRNSGLQQVENMEEGVFSSSPLSESSAASRNSSPVMVEDSIHSDDDDADDDGDTAMSMDEATSQTNGSESTSSSQSSLDERLRRAANQAGTRGIEYDEHGDDLPMELATSTVTNAFQPWVIKAKQQPLKDLNAMQDQENINPFSPAFKARAATPAVEDQNEDDVQDMSMDVTAAIGGILTRKSSPEKGHGRLIAPSRRRSSVGRLRSSSSDSTERGDTMDFTAARGEIITKSKLHGHSLGNSENAMMSDEDMSMEFTNVVGGVLNHHPSIRRQSLDSETTDDNEPMEMTTAVGGILPPIEERTEPQSDAGTKIVNKEMASAAGTIQQPLLRAASKSRAKQLTEEEIDADQPSESSRRPDDANTTPPRPKSAPLNRVATSVASETGSPSFALKPRLSGRGNAFGARPSTTPTNTPKQTPINSPRNVPQSTPTKQMTPLPHRIETPNKSPIMTNVTHRGASPKKIFKAEIRAHASPASAKTAAKQKGLFDVDEHTGQHTPSVVLRAPKLHQHLHRRSSGMGIDKEGMGSPRIAEMLDRRGSIGEAAAVFVPNTQESRVLRFQDPRAMEEEIDAERKEDERRESDRFVMEQEANEAPVREENTTLQLKEMIESMTPRKAKPNKLRGRKSLHVGAAKGILGKRPVELDIEDDDEDVESTPKRLRAVSRESSPVKQVHLPKPPSKAETTGRITRTKRRSIEDANSVQTITPKLSQSPGKTSVANTPQPSNRFKETPTDYAVTQPTSLEDKLDNVLDAVDISTAQAEVDKPDQQEKISLQSFLNMTGIHFIELSTTKRRQTIAPFTSSRPSQDSQLPSTESRFAAAATALPLFELYQHATRELKSYISSGRRIIRSIEAETLEEQPALFREYIDSRPDVRMVMDNQFRNGKTNARLQSREGWYAWRAQLVDGLQGGLQGIRRGMEEDLKRLTEQEKLLDEVVPALVQRHGHLEREVEMLQQKAYEAENADEESLKEARSCLAAADAEVEEKQALLDRLQQQMRDKDDALAAADELKEEFLSHIEEANRVREECIGKSPKEVHSLTEKVDAIGRQTGWRLAAAEEDCDASNDLGVALTMRYKYKLRLFFYPAAFQQSNQQNGRRKSRSRKSKFDSGSSTPISLTYSPVDEGRTISSPGLPTEQRFFLQILQSQLHAIAAMPGDTVSTKTILSMISNCWELAQKVSEEIRQLNLRGITSVSILGDEKLGVKTVVLFLGQCRVDVSFSISVSFDENSELRTASSVSARALYGQIVGLLEGPKATKVQQALTKEIESMELGNGCWANAVKGFEAWTKTQQEKREKQRVVERQPLSPKKTNIRATMPFPADQQVQAKSNSSSKERSTSMNPSNRPTVGDRDTRAKEMGDEPLPKNPMKQRKPDQPQAKIQEQKRQEQMKENVPPMTESEELAMKTPFRRVGALRRSPVAGI